MSAIAAMGPVEEDDFPDWVNPFVVKELRQGLHSRIFIAVFVMLHLCVALAMLVSLISPLHLKMTLQWTVEVAFVCLFLPLGGYFSVSDEVKADSLELIRVAGVSSGQIIMGKWQAQMAQATLLITSVLPYHLLQYYMNHESPLVQFAALYSCWLVSVVTSSAMMFFATIKGVGQMGCVLLGVPFMLLPVLFVVGQLMVCVFGSSNAGVILVVMETAILGAALLFFLSLAVSGLDMRVRAIPVFAPQDWTKDL